MKKVFTLDTVVTSLFGAIGYGGTYFLATYYGFNMLISTIICMVVGMVFDAIADRLIYNRIVQNNNKIKYAVYATFVLVFLVTYYVLAKVYEHSLFFDLGSQLTSVIGIPTIAFFISIGIRYIKELRLIKKYGSGEHGFVFDKEAKEAMEELKGENHELPEYSGKNPVVKTMTGSYIGKENKDGVSFLGIPYALAQRWKKPEPLAASDKIYEAYYFGNSEIQPESSHNMLTHVKQGEDCLNLNVWIATLEPQARKPVVVYIHGGDGRYGGSANPVCHLENIAKTLEDAVFVSVNYRFGVLGVIDFSSSGCPDASEYTETTGLPLLDQIEALKWIKTNIVAFGGNPENITVVGDSTGGACICMLAAMEKVKGLFCRALILGASSHDTPADNGQASLLAKKLLEEFNAGSVAELKTVTPEQLREFSRKNYYLLETPPRDGIVAPSDISQLYRKGVASDVEFIFGFAADDISTWKAMLAKEIDIYELTGAYYDNYRNVLGVEKAEKLDGLLEKYMQPGMSITDAKQSLLVDLMYKANVLHDCRILSEAGSKIRCFCWDVSGSIEKLTSNTVSMVTAILGNNEIAEQMGYLHDKGLTEIMQAIVGKFIHGQTPELYNNELRGVSEIVWDEFDMENEQVLHIQNDSIKMDKRVFSETIREIEQLVIE